MLSLFLFQISQPHFYNTGVFIPIYGFLFFSFFLNSFLFFENARLNFPYNSSLFLFDTLLITSLFYIFDKGVFFFPIFYSANIFLAGLIYRKKGAFLVAMMTAICFNVILIIKEPFLGLSLYIVAILNNVTFFSVASLSGFLGEQLGIAGTQIKQKEKTIRALHDFNKLIVESAHMGFLVIDKSGKITHSNVCAVKILEVETLFGLFISQFVPQLNILSEIEKHTGPDKKFDHSYKTSSGEKKILDILISPMDSSIDKNLDGFVVVFQDSTKIKNLQRRLREQEKLAAIGRLSAGIAHEIRNPLASISGSVQMLSVSAQKEEKRLMNIVLKEVDRLNNLIVEFLDFARPSHFEKKEKIYLNKIMHEVLEIAKLNSNLNQNVFQNVLIKDIGFFIGDESKITQALLNIVINAYHAMEETKEPELKIRTYNEDGFTVLMIQDNGIGMDSESISRVFEPFHTTKKKGTGLGLAVTHKILENHNIGISVTSQKGEGAVFYLKFLTSQLSVEKEIEPYKG